MDIAVVTAIYGDYDPVPPLPPGFNQYIIVTDKPVESDWYNIVMPPFSNNPRLSAKLPRMRPDLFCSTEYSVWMDATLRDRNGWIAENARRMFEEGREFITWEHPERKCLFEEAAFSINVEKYKDQPIEQQARYYSMKGMPEQWGLYANGTIGRKHTDRIKDLGNEWLLHNIMWSIQDQVSLSYVLWSRGIRPSVWPAHQHSGVVGWDAGHH